MATTIAVLHERIQEGRNSFGFIFKKKKKKKKKIKKKNRKKKTPLKKKKKPKKLEKGKITLFVKLREKLQNLPQQRS